MDRESAFGSDANTAFARARVSEHGQHQRMDWQVVHHALRTIAKRRAGLDAEEARWLREAMALKIWRELGMSSAHDYLERVLGYAPRTASDRLRVAHALGELPQLTAAWANGELAYSAVRELTRVATGATEEEWCARALGKNLRQIEELVADHRLGDRPDDPKDPSVRMHVVRLELSAETYALLRQARQVLDTEHGTCLSEDELVAQLCHAVLDGTAPGVPLTPSGPREPSAPDVRSAPNEPSALNVRNAPSEPDMQSGSSAAGGSSRLSVPSAAGEPSRPSAPSAAGEPSQPSAPSAAGDPSRPSAPSAAGDPSRPSASSDSGEPSRPSAPSAAGEPCRPSAPNAAGEPSRPSAPSAAGAPSRPSASSASGEPSRPSAPLAPTGRAKFQISLTVCERCQQGWQHGAGAKIAIGPAAVERALCDAQHLGSIDGDTPARAYQDVAPSVARFVWHRDGGRCRVPGCRSARGIEIHHLIHRADGGSHDASNLVLACSSCHSAHHEGTLRISGTAKQLEVTRPAATSSSLGAGAATQAHEHPTDSPRARAAAQLAKAGPHVGTAAGIELVEVCSEAQAGLQQLGWKPSIARAAVRAAASALGDGATLERLLVEAMRRCPMPTAHSLA